MCVYKADITLCYSLKYYLTRLKVTVHYTLTFTKPLSPLEALDSTTWGRSPPVTIDAKRRKPSIVNLLHDLTSWFCVWLDPFCVSELDGERPLH